MGNPSTDGTEQLMVGKRVVVQDAHGRKWAGVCETDMERLLVVDLDDGSRFVGERVDLVAFNS